MVPSYGGESEVHFIEHLIRQLECVSVCVCGGEYLAKFSSELFAFHVSSLSHKGCALVDRTM